MTASITVAKSLLADMLKKVGPIVPKRSTLPVLNCVHMTAKEGHIVITATDLDRRVELAGELASLPLDTDIAACVLYKDFADVLRSIKSEVVTLERNDGTVVLRDGHARVTMNIIDPTEFPPGWEQADMGPAITMPLADLLDVARMVGIAASEDDARPTLKNVHVVTRGGRLVFEATDGYRLATYTAGEWPEKIDKMVAELALDTLPGLFDGYSPEDTVSLEWFGPDGNNVRISVDDDAVLYAAGVAGNFPDVTRIIPTEYSHVFAVSRQELVDALKLVGIFARDQANIARLSFDKERVMVFGQAVERGEAVATISSSVIKGDGTVDIAQNSRLLESGLSGTGAETVHLGMNGSSKPMGIWEAENDRWFYLQMPMHTNR